MGEIGHKTVRYRGREVQVPIPDFPYVPFPSGSTAIRLLEVLPGKSPDSVVKCRLRHYGLDDKIPVYAALSYEWGNPSITDPIFVDGFEFPVTTNLREALQVLRSQAGFFLWVDAICINQNDNKEKSSHVPRMKEIYHEADYVIVWLGVATKGSAWVMRVLTRIEVSHRPASLRRGNDWLPSKAYLKWRDPELISFLRNGFWRRCWIIQEIALGSRVLVMCGSHRVEWEAVVLLMKQIHDQSAVQLWATKHIQHLCQSRSSRAEARPVPLLQALSDSCEAEASDPRDKVYALLGLTFDKDAYVTTPNYSWSKEQICISMSNTVIWSKKSLDIIFAGPKSTRSRLRLPSWCPDYLSWPDDPICKSLVSYLSGLDDRYRGGTLRSRWRATGNSLATRDVVTVDAQFVTTRGLRVGKINGLGCLLSDERPPEHSKSSLRVSDTLDRIIFESISRALTMYDVDEVKPGSIRATRVHNLYYHLYEFEQPFKAGNNDMHFRTKFRNVIDWRKRNKRFMICGEHFKYRSHNTQASKFSGAYKEAKLESLERSFGASVEAAVESPGDAFMDAISKRRQTSERRLPADIDQALKNLTVLIDEGLRIMTTSKDDVGWAHPSARVGDEIFLLHGCSMPAILRRSTHVRDAFRVVGHAYVNGVMNGEKWELSDKGDMQVLRLV